ncbi:hypothetical protein [Winogradskyella sp.]|uniref:hypothetical protein n=1 Tax=Winogradskyella sp. TaxID=1883156 RepID=UPI003BAAE49D
MNNYSYTTDQDTLLIRTKKHKGSGLFYFASSDLYFEKDNDSFPYKIEYPDHLSKIKRAQIITDLKAEKRNYIDIITGKLEDKDVFIIDENNNKSFLDDSIRFIKPINWTPNEELIKVHYNISNGISIVTDSSWVQIGLVNDYIQYGKSEYLTAKFQLGENDFKIGLIDYVSSSNFTYNARPQIVLLETNGNEKATLDPKDFYNKKEYLKLGNHYYKFKDISNNGELITLIKEKNFKDKIGIQIGVIAPSFEAVSIEGNLISSHKLYDKATIIANSCGCGGDKASTKAYYDIRSKFGDTINIIRLDYNIRDSTNGIQLDMNNKLNKDIYNKFRGKYCSRMAYVVGKNNRIVDKFDITNWQKNLLNPLY